MATLNVRIPDELNDSLVVSAKTRDRSKGYIVREALEYYLLELKEGAKDAEIALARMSNPNRRLCSSSELQKMLESKLNV